MCTVSWIRSESGCSVFCNRDERGTRLPARPPARMTRHGVAYLAPIDGDRGGTWIAVNENGLCLTLLNYYRTEGDVEADGARSRGLLLADLADAAGPADAVGRLETGDLAPYNPFVLLAIASAGEPFRFQWDGKASGSGVLSSADSLQSTSSFSPDEVNQARREWFTERVRLAGGMSEAALDGFHRSVHPAGPAYGPCMFRLEASTVSYTRVRIDALRVSMTYEPVCAETRSFGPAHEVELGRVSRV